MSSLNVTSLEMKTRLENNPNACRIFRLGISKHDGRTGTTIQILEMLTSNFVATSATKYTKDMFSLIPVQTSNGVVPWKSAGAVTRFRM